MKYSIFAIALSLVSFTDASKQLLCKAQAGSVLNFLVRDKTQPINCISNSSQFEITQEQYDGLVERVEATENDVLEAKMGE